MKFIKYVVIIFITTPFISCVNSVKSGNDSLPSQIQSYEDIRSVLKTIRFVNDRNIDTLTKASVTSYTTEQIYNKYNNVSYSLELSSCTHKSILSETDLMFTIDYYGDSENSIQSDNTYNAQFSFWTSRPKVKETVSPVNSIKEFPTPLKSELMQRFSGLTFSLNNVDKAITYEPPSDSEWLKMHNKDRYDSLALLYRKLSILSSHSAEKLLSINRISNGDYTCYVFCYEYTSYEGNDCMVGFDIILWWNDKVNDVTYVMSGLLMGELSVMNKDMAVIFSSKLIDRWARTLDQ